MGRNYTPAALAQLRLGAGEVLTGDASLILLKAMLESGVSYLGGYPGAPTSGLYDAIADSYDPILKEMGISFEGSGNEAAAAAMLEASVFYPVRGSVNWKVVGNNVAADALAHIAQTGVVGGAVAVVGEDYGLNSTTVAEKSQPYALKSTLVLMDPRGDAEVMARLMRESFAISEASHAPVMYLMRTRTGNIKGSMVCRDNVEPAISARHPIEQLVKDRARMAAPPHAFEQERQKFAFRMPAARAYIRAQGLNEVFPGSRPRLGVITHGMLYNTSMRALYTLGEADLTGATSLPFLVLNVLNPIVPEEIVSFLRDKDQVLVVEEGMPNLLEDQVRSLAQQHDLHVRIYGKDVLPMAGEYTPAVLIDGYAGFLATRVYAGAPRSTELLQQSADLRRHLQEASSFMQKAPAARSPIFCTGCPERPIFTAMKMAEEEHGAAHYAGDIGCYTMGGYAPFDLTDSITGMGTGLASTSALARMAKPRIVSFIGDGTFWHSGLTTSFANAAFNRQAGTMVIFENYWTSMTGQQENPNSPQNMRGEPNVEMNIEKTLRGMGIGQVERVNPYQVGKTLQVLEKAITAPAPGLNVIVSDGECQLEKNRRLKAERRDDLAHHRRVRDAKFGVDEEVCTGDHACIRLNGCPSLTVKANPNPLRDDEIVTIENSCVGCGLCGEIAHAAVLCPSFYEVEVITNPGVWERVKASVNRFLLRTLMRLAA